jgi:hypothetical protein
MRANAGCPRRRTSGRTSRHGSAARGDDEKRLLFTRLYSGFAQQGSDVPESSLDSRHPLLQDRDLDRSDTIHVQEVQEEIGVNIRPLQDVD